MQNLYFVRHGETELNAADRVQGGDIDSPLLEQSRKNAVKTGKALRNAPIEVVISSPQFRAKETAQLIVSQFASPLPIEEEESLKELGFGEWEGQYVPDLKNKYPELLRQLREEPSQYDPTSFGGETYTDLISRGTQSILRHAEQNPDSDLLFVGHSVTLTATILSLAGFPVKDIRSKTPMGNTSITRLIRKENEFILDTWNYTDHLS